MTVPEFQALRHYCAQLINCAGVRVGALKAEPGTEASTVLLLACFMALAMPLA